MSEDPANGRAIDLAALAAEAVVMLEAASEERGVTIELERVELAAGKRRGARSHPDSRQSHRQRGAPFAAGGKVALTFVKTAGTASVTVADEGPGIAAADQQRIFERFERAGDQKEGPAWALPFRGAWRGRLAVMSRWTARPGPARALP